MLSRSGVDPKGEFPDPETRGRILRKPRCFWRTPAVSHVVMRVLFVRVLRWKGGGVDHTRGGNGGGGFQ